MAADTPLNPLLKRPLYIFDLPPELLYSLTLRQGSSQPAAPDEGIPAETSNSRPSPTDDGVSQSKSCNLCKLSFQTVQEQRQHVRSDFHRYNLKLNIKSIPPIDESTFTHMIGDLDESISGSDSSESEDDEDAAGFDVKLSSLLKKQAKLSQNTESGSLPKRKKLPPGTAPMLWFSSNKLGEDDMLGVYKAILTNEDQANASTSANAILRKKQYLPVQAKQGGKATANEVYVPANDPHYFLCMIGGGHFAAMVVSLAPEIRKGQGGIEERHAIVRAHKTFHRYTTRRKQGGSQSANDNAKGNAHSVGSSIRRANEAALELDIRKVLSDWREMIDTAELIFVRATGSHNRRTLFGPYDGQVLSSRDTRLRGFPFSTRRATQAELLRSFQELTRLKVGKVVEVAPESPRSDSMPSKAVRTKAEAPKLTKQEEAAALHTSQLENLIRRSKAPAVLIYLEKNQLSPNFEFFPPTEHHHAPTLLHLSASANAAAVVSALLLKAKADPTLQNGESKTPYEIAGDAKTRDAFRVARYQLGDSALDWTKARVPSGITQAEVDAKAKHDQATQNAAETERRKKDLEQLQQQDDLRVASRMDRKTGPGKTLSSATEKTGAERREEDMRGLTPEQRMRVERERRARAAEERMKRMQGST